MRFSRARLGACAAIAAAVATSLVAQEPTITIEGDDITIRGCVSRADPKAPALSRTLVWSQSDIIMAGIQAAGASDPVGTTGVADRVFYWLDDEDDLGEHVGQEVEVKGSLGEFEQGEIEIEPDGEFTEIRLEVPGRDAETARVPSAWLGGIDPDDDKQFDIATRKVTVDEVDVVGPCSR